jgi:hypothetical protein
MITIDDKFEVTFKEGKHQLGEEQIRIFKSWLQPPVTPPLVFPIYASFTRTDPKSGFTQFLHCVLTQGQNILCSELQLCEDDPSFRSSMWDLVNNSYEVQALSTQPYRDTVYPVSYEVWTFVLVDDPRVYKFTHVLRIGSEDSVNNNDTGECDDY